MPNRATRTHQAQVYAFVGADDKPFVIHLSTPSKFWQALARVASRPEWIDDPRFVTKETRGRNYDVLQRELAAIFRTDTRAAWLEKLQAAEHLGLRQDVPHQQVGRVGLVRNGVRMSVTSPEIRSASPELGEHTNEILAELKVGA